MPREDTQFKTGKVKTGGRRKGVPNKFTTLNESFLRVYQELGGDDALLAWAKENPKDFYQMIRVMLPKSVEAKVDTDLKVVVVDNFEMEREKSPPSLPARGDKKVTALLEK